MKTIITAIACCLIMTAATAQENYYKTDCDIYIDQDTTLVCRKLKTRITLAYKSDPIFESVSPEDEKEQRECNGISLHNDMFQDWDKIESTMMAAFLEIFTDEQIKEFYANKYKMKTLFSFYFFHDRDGNVVKLDMAFENSSNFTSVPPVAYAKFMQVFRDKCKLNVPDKKYPYYSTVYGFMVPDLSIIPKSTKK